MSSKHWTETELQILREHYGSKYYSEIAALLPGRTAKAVKSTAKRLGIACDAGRRETAARNARTLKLRNLTGLIFGRLHVISRVEKPSHLKSKQSYYLVECECPKKSQFIASSTALVSGNTTSCGCFRLELLRAYNGTRKLENRWEVARNGLISRYKIWAAEKSVSYELSVDEFTELTQRPCKYCGIKPHQVIKKGDATYTYNGIDAVDCKRGYDTENSVPCCKICNFAKNKLTVEEWTNWTRRFTAYNSTPVPPKTSC